jgi:hypothetical protein
MQKISNYIFVAVRDILFAAAKLLKLSYNEVNVIAYYGLIPLSWMIMLDKITDLHYFTFGFLVFVLGFIAGCRNFKAYCDWLFTKSVIFLKSFNKYGSNYILTSVLVCIVVPVIIYLFLIFLI